MQYVHGSLFSGIGGFDFAAELMGWENAFHCEINPFARHILKYYWPNAQSYEDITSTDFTIWRSKIDILSGGFPCQPFSSAGKRKGTADDRHLWPEMLRAIREIAPHFVVGETVSNIAHWTGGEVFEMVCCDLENEGYEIIPFNIPAAGIGAPHQRQRIWFIAKQLDSMANAGGIGCGGRELSKGDNPKRQPMDQAEPDNRHKVRCKASGCGYSPCNACGKSNGGHKSGKGKSPGMDLEGHKLHKAGRKQSPNYATASDRSGMREQIPGWKAWPAQSPLLGRDDGISAGLDRITVPSRGKRRTLNEQQSFNRWRRESIKGYGNAIVPQIALEIFRAILHSDLPFSD